MTTRFDTHKEQGWRLDLRDPDVIRSFMPGFKWLYNYYFRVQTSGWQHIPVNQKVLLVGSHNGGLAAPDMAMMIYDWVLRFGAERPVYGLMHPNMWSVLPPHLTQLAAKFGCVRAHPRMAIAAFKQDASVLVYPGGAKDVFRPHSMRDRIFFNNNHAFVKLALRENVPIIPVISYGAHDTLIVLAELYPMAKQLHEWGMPWLLGIDPEVFPIYLGLPWGLAIGPLPNIPLPVPIHTRVCPPVVFNHYGEEAARDRAYVEECFDRVQNEMQAELDTLISRYRASVKSKNQK